MHKNDKIYKSKRHFFFKDVAIEIGVDEAIMLNHLIYWIAVNLMKNQNYFEGRTWTFNSVENFAIFFPYWSPGQIRRVLKSLVKKVIVIEGNFNKHKYDRTTWYALEDEKFWMTKEIP